ncbi:hypothetical protein PR048_011543 [Dryococelus australis]|uniref:Uncharacterized protein n=1 Tax=Dryococelus australis TaxID=614101 RepID=A0ABQ9HLV5_9NEOP|nr:hypothetical protein PR048_011543 [Dryococelus australis]
MERISQYKIPEKILQRLCCDSSNLKCLRRKCNNCKINYFMMFLMLGKKLLYNHGTSVRTMHLNTKKKFSQRILGIEDRI